MSVNAHVGAVAWIDVGNTEEPVVSFGAKVAYCSIFKECINPVVTLPASVLWARIDIGAIGVGTCTGTTDMGTDHMYVDPGGLGMAEVH